MAEEKDWWDCDLWLVSFRVMSEKLTTRAIGSRLDLRPDTAFDTGDQIPDEERTFVFTRAVWTLDSTLPFTDDLADHLLAMLEVLEPRADAIRLLHSEGCVIDFFAALTCGTDPSGTNLDPGVLGRVASLGANLDLSVTPDSGG